MNHRKPSRRWPHVLVAAAITLTTIGLTASVQAASATPAPVCTNGLCTVTFDYTGDYYVYAPPAGIRTMSFELAGAQGGRTGGLGGKVTGSFSSIPATMNIYVGGAGKQGASALGGFNGGGVAGGSHTDEGSGGGASDIRLTSALDDRIVVAGGGGGTGGWVGLAGAPGGGLIAQAGSGSSPNGGGGATQLAGGSGGSGYSAGSGSAGTKGVGGTGGIGSAGGGGGGGGGYFGGGGGGGDGIPSGTDGAGGGGGSSYASANYTKSVTHTSGARSGNGQVILTYAYSPTVSTFATVSNAGNQSSVSYNLVFNQTIGGLETTDFGFAGTAGGCSVSAISGSGSSYAITVSGCSDGTMGLTLAADSVTGAATGPVSIAASNQITLDRKNPSFTITSPSTPSNLVALPFTVTSDEPVTGLGASSFSVVGTSCQVNSVTGSSQSFVVTVGGCASATTATLTLKASGASDLSSNSGPLASVVSTGVLVDLDAPTPLSFTKDPTSRPGLIGYSLVFAEPVTGLSASSLQLHGDSCQLSKLSGSKDAYSIWLTDCSQGASAWVTLKALSATDAAGNQGPLAALDSPTVSIDDQSPTATIALLERASQTAQPVFEVRFSEAVQGLVLDSFSHSGTATGCKFTMTTVLTGLTYRLAASSCSAGTVRLVLPVNIVQDATGNLGPLSAINSDAVTIDRTASQSSTGTAQVKKRSHPSGATPTTGSTPITPEESATNQPENSGRSLPKAKPPVKLATLTSETELSQPATNDKTLGFAALALAFLLGGGWLYRRMR